MRRALRIAAVALAAAVALSTAALAVAVYGWRYPVERLRPDRSTSLVVVDRHGNVLRERALDGGGRARWVGLGEIPPILVAATLAGEDRRFFAHAGVDPLGLVRALVLDASAGRLAYGGSTLTMQLVKIVDPHPRSTAWKVVDAVRAWRLERALGKRAILEQYLNRAYYGDGAFGVEAAARAWFGKSASTLSDGEATLLAAIPRAPTAYAPRRHLDAALARRAHLLDLLVDAGALDAPRRARIDATPLSFVGHDAPLAPGAFRAPHFVDLALSSLPAGVAAHGGVVHTTLDLPLQERVEAALRAHLDRVGDAHVTQAGVVVLDARTGAVRALVGSRDWSDDAHAGKLDVLTTPRHPGSALKPFTYALALEGGATPATIAWDVDDFPSRWHMRNADGREHGPVRLRVALPSSYNLAAVDVAESVGVGRLLERLRLAGLDTLDGAPADYGPALTLGDGAVRLLDLAAASAFLTGGGVFTPAWTVERVEVPGADPIALPPPAARRLFDERTAWLTMDILADASARRAAFGDDLPLDLPFPVAAKTGTSGGFADNVAVLATREYVVLAWAGNFDGSAMHHVLAMWGAAPLARAALLAAANGDTPSLPPPPPGIEAHDVCALSGMAPGPSCPRVRERFAAGSAPTKTCDWHVGNRVEWPLTARRWAARYRR